MNSSPTPFGTPTHVVAATNVTGHAGVPMNPQQPGASGTGGLLNLSFEQRNQLLEFLGAVIRKKFHIAAFAIVMSALAWVLASLQTPYYKSTVTLIVDAPKLKTVRIDDVYDTSSNMNFYATQLEVMRSPDVINRAVDKLRLVDNPAFDPRKPPNGAVDRLLATLGFAANGASPETPFSDLRAMVAGHVRSATTVEAVRGSSLVKISFESTDRQAAALVANGLADAYVENDLDSKFSMTQRATDWMNGRLVELRAKLNDSERALQAFRDSRGFVNAGSGASTLAASQFGDLTGRLLEARAKRTEAQFGLEQVTKAKNSNQPLDSVPAIMRVADVTKAKDALQSSERKFAEISERYGREHPKYVQVDIELRASRDTYKRQVDLAVATLQQEFDAARAAETAVEQILANARTAVSSVNRNEFQLQALEREVAANKQLYDMFMGRLKETNATDGLQTAIGRVLEAAGPGVQTRPNTRLAAIAGFAVALLLAIGLTILLEFLDSTLRSSDDVERRLQLPSLGSVPIVEKSDGDATTLYQRNSKGVFAEAIRTIRTGVLLSSVDVSRKAIAVTSSVPEEGKSTVSAALALAHAQTKTTVLVDSDMRRPTLGQRFGFDKKTAGLSDIISGSVSIEDALRTVEGSNLKLITSGTIPPNPLELILSPRYREVLAQLQERFEIVVIDTPPVKLVSDAVVIAGYTTGVLYVSKADSTPYRMAQKGVSDLRRGGGRLIGVVLNRLDFEKADKYYGEYSGYASYGYQSYYGDDSDKPSATGKRGKSRAA